MPATTCRPAGNQPVASPSVAGFGTARGSTSIWPTTSPADATSHLSPYLHFGCLSANEVLARVDHREGLEDFARQLCWRDFHHQVLAARPGHRVQRLPEAGPSLEEPARRLDAWKEGRTGYPIVDAGMRQLPAEGFMHNRARLIVASFLTKTSTSTGAPARATSCELLVDGDLANNAGNWQWVAGTGNDTARTACSTRSGRPDASTRTAPTSGASPGARRASRAGRSTSPGSSIRPVRERLDYPEPLVPPPG